MRTVAKQGRSQRPERGSGTEYVVGVDGTPASIAAARWAVERAERDGARVVVVHAYQVNALPSVAGPVRTPQMRRTSLHHAQEVLDVVMRALPAGAEPAGAEVVPLLVEGPADRVLIDHSAGAALLVLGARPQHTHPRLRFIGSVALRCLRGATCPVVLVPQTAAKAADSLAGAAARE